MWTFSAANSWARRKNKANVVAYRLFVGPGLFIGSVDSKPAYEFYSTGFGADGVEAAIEKALK